MRAHRLVFTRPRTVELEETEVEQSNLGDWEVVATTDASLISAGTELANLSGTAELTPGGTTYPLYPGYAAAGRVVAAGREVGLAAGTPVYMTTPHASAVRFDARRTICVPLPPGLDAARATFARLACVSMTTLRLASARAGDRVGVVGLGLVGNLAAQVFASAGMAVVGYDVIPARRALLERCGLPARDPAAIGEEDRSSCRLVIEASGRAEGAVTALDLAAVGGDVSLVGAPWLRTTAVPASAVLQPVFLKYLRLISGWEWSLPHHDEPFRPGSLHSNARYALAAIARGTLIIEPLLTQLVAPAQAQQAYDDLAAHRETHIGVVFDWSAPR